MAEEKAFSGELTIQTALQLIRYDIPVLILGKSSIGKSYTLIDITKKWNLPHSLLYIGSEKSENIEGVPKLTEREEGKEILEYLQPYWFPNAKVITKSVENGRRLFDKFIKNYWDAGSFDYGYIDLHSLLNALSYLKWSSDDLIKSKKNEYEMEVYLVDHEYSSGDRKLNDKAPFPLTKKPYQAREDDGIESEQVIKDEYKQDDLRDFCNYLTTALGYGNYWLILDEIDKVEEYDKDKFAPLLHIVRERTLKNFRMIDINNGDGLNIPFSITGGNNGYKEVIENINKQLDTGQSVLDTRVMGVANKTKNIEEALFRRFIQIVAEDLMIWRKTEITQGQARIESCLIGVKNDMVANNIQQGSLFVPENLIQRIDEVNLQWQYNFLPKMLNTSDIAPNIFRSNLLKEYAESMSAGGDEAWLTQQKFTSLYKILEDNFKSFDTSDEMFNTADHLFECLSDEVISTGNANDGENIRSTEEEKQTVRGEIEQLVKELGDDSLVSVQISENLREAYSSVIGSSSNEQTRLQNLHAWTDDVKTYLEAVMYSPDGKLVPMEVSKHLVPALLNVFYTEIGQDSNNQADNVAVVVNIFQGFFREIATLIGDKTNISFDKGAVETAFYGATISEIKTMDESERMNTSFLSLFGADKRNFIHSAANGIGQQSIIANIPNFVRRLSRPEASKFMKGGEYRGITMYLRNNFSDELEKLATSMEATAKDKDTKKYALIIKTLFVKE